jgi:DNA-binding protein H-NS
MSNYIEYMKQIDELTKKAEAARKEERGAAIAEIKAKIKAFGFTAEDLGLAEKSARGRPAAVDGPGRGAGRKAGAKKADGPGRGARKGTPSPLKGIKRKVKYRGPAGQPWSGVGRKPVWVTEALAAGKTLEEFAVSE